MDTKELRRLLSEATPGPWVVGYENDPGAYRTVSCVIEGNRLHHVECRGNGTTVNGRWVIIDSKVNAALIAAMRNALPDVLDELDAARAREAVLVAVLDDIRKSPLWGVEARVDTALTHVDPAALALLDVVREAERRASYDHDSELKNVVERYRAAGGK